MVWSRQVNRLPFVEQAEMGDRKIRGYLLSHSHSTGHAKARFFSGPGFDAGAPELLREALLLHARTHPVTVSEETRFGSRYVVDDPLESPSGRPARVRAVWFVESGESVVRFVTAYPQPGRRA